MMTLLPKVPTYNIMYVKAARVCVIHNRICGTSLFDPKIVIFRNAEKPRVLLYWF